MHLSTFGGNRIASPVMVTSDRPLYPLPSSCALLLLRLLLLLLHPLLLLLPLGSCSLFVAVDTDRSGSVNARELQAALSSGGMV